MQLIKESKIRIDNDYQLFNKAIGFEKGGLWMSKYLNKETVIHDVKFKMIGIFKYAFSSIGLIIPLLVFDFMSIEYALVSIILFYSIEVHFLFIFPLIIDDEKPILRKSITALYRVGFLNAIFNVIPIGFYMILGLLNIRKPFFNWYIGCLSIVIWYEKEIRFRL
jgi:hypothetical protein